MPVVGEVIERTLGRGSHGHGGGELQPGHAHEDMRVVAWDGGRVSTRDAVEAALPLTGQRLRDGYAEAISAVTLGLVRVRTNSVVAGPLTLLRFGRPKVTRNSVDWAIEGGLLAGRPGGGGMRSEEVLTILQTKQPGAVPTYSEENQPSGQPMPMR